MSETQLSIEVLLWIMWHVLCFGTIVYLFRKIVHLERLVAIRDAQNDSLRKEIDNLEELRVQVQRGWYGAIVTNPPHGDRSVYVRVVYTRAVNPDTPSSSKNVWERLKDPWCKD
jgi:hypothetical protein